MKIETRKCDACDILIAEDGIRFEIPIQTIAWDICPECAEKMMTYYMLSFSILRNCSECGGLGLLEIQIPGTDKMNKIPCTSCSIGDKIVKLKKPSM